MSNLDPFPHTCLFLVCVFSVLGMGASPTQGQALEGIEVPQGIPLYVKADDIEGELTSQGSDTLAHVMVYWAEGFDRIYPETRIAITKHPHSLTAIPALIAGTSDLGPMSTEIPAGQVQEFKSKFGYAPMVFTVGHDAIAVYVNKRNPLVGLPLPKVAAVFAVPDPKATSPVTWGNLGLTGEWQKRPIRRYGHHEQSGTHRFLDQIALRGAAYREDTDINPGHAAVVDDVGADVCGIGYACIGHGTRSVRALKIAKDDGGPLIQADAQSIRSGTYPLSRDLYIVVNKKPGEPLPLLLRGFLRFVLCRQGQEAVVRAGFIPLTAEQAAEQLKKLSE